VTPAGRGTTTAIPGAARRLAGRPRHPARALLRRGLHGERRRGSLEAAGPSKARDVQLSLREAARALERVRATSRSIPATARGSLSQSGDGAYPTPTMARFLQWLPRGFAGRDRARPTPRCIASSRAAAARSSGSDVAGGPRDVFVTPSWVPCSISREDASSQHLRSPRAAGARAMAESNRG
jgi:hypothetical protein